MSRIQHALHTPSQPAERKSEADSALASAWPHVMRALSGIVARSRLEPGESGDFELQTLEVNLGVEAGLSIGLTTRTDASLTLTFRRKPETL